MTQAVHNRGAAGGTHNTVRPRSSSVFTLLLPLPIIFTARHFAAHDSRTRSSILFINKSHEISAPVVNFVSRSSCSFRVHMTHGPYGVVREWYKKLSFSHTTGCSFYSKTRYAYAGQLCRSCGCTSVCRRRGASENASPRTSCWVRRRKWNIGCVGTSKPLHRVSCQQFFHRSPFHSALGRQMAAMVRESMPLIKLSRLTWRSTVFPGKPHSTIGY